MNRRRMLNSIHRDIARKGIPAADWFNRQSFHASAADMPFDRIPMAELDKAGASLLPKADPPVEPEHPTTDAGIDDLGEDYPGQHIDGPVEPAELTDVPCSAFGKMHETRDGACIHCGAVVQVCDYCTTGFFLSPINDHSPYCSDQCAANAQGDNEVDH